MLEALRVMMASQSVDTQVATGNTAEVGSVVEAMRIVVSSESVQQPAGSNAAVV